MKVWQKRFQHLPDKSIDKFTSSLQTDFFLYPYDIKGSIAHVKMLQHSGYILKEEEKILLEGLKKVKEEIDNKKFKFNGDEDIHMAVERRLKELVGNVADKLHTARSRNDQVVLDERMFLKEKTFSIIKKIKRVQETILRKAEENIDIIMPGFTHFRPAQPVLFSHWLMAYFWKFQRDKERFYENYKRIDILPSGSCALAGTSLKIDREYLAKELGFSKISENSMDSVSERDFLIEFSSSSMILFIHLSRLSEELIIFSSPYFNWIKIPEKYLTGSSIMPQKKNPDTLELIRGKASKILGYASSIASLLKNLPLTYNRDLQEDKEILSNTPEEVISSLEIINGIISDMEINKDKMEEDSKLSYTLSTDLVELMVEKGIPFRKGYQKIGELVKKLEEEKKNFSSISNKEWKEEFNLSNEEIKKLLNVRESAERKKSYGGTSSLRVKEQIKKGWKKIESKN